MKRPHPHPLFPPRSICADYIQYTLHSLSQLAPGNPPWYFTLLNMFNSHKQADTPGCTNQACGFRDHLSEIKELGYDIYGLSKDKPAALKRVCPLSLPLLLSPDLSHSYMNLHSASSKTTDQATFDLPIDELSWWTVENKEGIELYPPLGPRIEIDKTVCPSLYSPLQLLFPWPFARIRSEKKLMN